MNLAVISCHFNPGGFSQPRRNLFRFLRQMEADGIPVFVAELAYNDESWVLPEDSRNLRLRTSRSNVMWHKENLLNLLESIVPVEFDCLAWVDVDVWFQNVDWFEQLQTALDSHPVVQPYEKVIWTTEDGQAGIAAQSAASLKRLEPQGTSGFAWGARRTLWSDSGGLYDEAILGSGDSVNACAWLPCDMNGFHWLGYPNLSQNIERLSAWFAREGGDRSGCGYVKGNLWHEWHGDHARRGHVRRHSIVDSLDFERHLLRRQDGLLEFSHGVPDIVSSKISSYFRSRNEDGRSSSGEVRQSARENSEIVEPWMEADELHVIGQLLNSSDCVLEFGSGGSSKWLSQRVREVHAIEHDRRWAAKVMAETEDNVIVHCRPPEFYHNEFDPVEPGQFESYLAVPDLLQLQFDACVVDGRARIEAALAAANWLKSGGWLFFHDWFSRQRYTSRLSELLPYYDFDPERSVTGTNQTLAVFRRRRTL